MIFGNLVKRVRQLLPDKLITVFGFGGYTNFDATTMNAISYMWPDFGADWSTPGGLGNSKWAKMSIHCTDGRPSAGVIQSSAANYSGIITYDIAIIYYFDILFIAYSIY